MSSSINEKIDYSNDKLGVTLCAPKQVLVEYRNNEYNKFITTLYHELGHVLDFYTYSSYKEDWTKLYEKYKDNYVYPIKELWLIPDTYMNSEKHEFFAGIYEAYYLYPDYLKENAPELYDYMLKEEAAANELIAEYIEHDVHKTVY